MNFLSDIVLLNALENKPCFIITHHPATYNLALLACVWLWAEVAASHRAAERGRFQSRADISLRQHVRNGFRVHRTFFPWEGSQDSKYLRSFVNLAVSRSVTVELKLTSSLIWKQVPLLWMAGQRTPGNLSEFSHFLFQYFTSIYHLLQIFLITLQPPTYYHYHSKLTADIRAGYP
jgi:hypothetical protein